MMTSRVRIAAFSSVIVLVAACATNKTDDDIFGSGTQTPFGATTGGAGGAATVVANGGTTGTDNGAGGGIDVGQGGGITVIGDSGGGPTCSGTSQTAQQVPLDIYVMMDQSGSMSDVVKGGKTKWEAITAAISAFTADAGSTGIGMGIQFFPIVHAGVPGTCDVGNDAACGVAGPCAKVGICLDFLGEIDGSCDPDAADPTSTCGDPDDDECDVGGVCSGDNTYVCGEIGKGNCDEQGDCLKKGICSGAECVVDDYATPAVEIAALPASASDINGAVSAHMPNGGTPTAPALTGAVQHAAAWQAAHPDHVVITVLATDGLPTDCAPTDIDSVAKIASDAKAASPSIATFVIGIFSKTDLQSGAQDNLDTISKAGSGQAAFIVNTQTDDAETAFVAALNTIRGQAATCDFTLPMGDANTDFTKVNVDVTPPGGTASTIYYVGDASMCDATTGGWYYDVDPSTGATPTKVSLCDATCAGFKATANTTVDVAIGCETVVPPVK